MPEGVLSDRTIRALAESGRLLIDPWDPGMIQPASVDLKLGNSFRVFHNHRIQAIDLAAPPQDLTEQVVIDKETPFVIHPGEFVLGRTQEEVGLPDDIVARIEGKALALDTPVPTPGGWTTIGEIEPGSEVFSPDGQPVRVTAVTDPLFGRPCREVEFSDGTVVTADAGHGWEVQSKYDRRCRARHRVLTTDRIAASIRCAWAPREYAFHVPLAAPVAYPQADQLPVDPYVLGAWIGDGTSTQPVVTTVDPPILQEIGAAGYGVRRASGPYAYWVGGTGHTRHPRTGQYTRNDSLSSQLRNMGLLGSKRIPREYMQAGVEQREALLAGLMDTDGYVDKLGRCDLTTVSATLAEQYRELIASLGFRPVTAVKTATLYGKLCGLRYEVTFTPHRQVFRLPRKAARLRLTVRGHRSRSIRSVVETESVPVKCIEVESPRGAFLITRSFITTHNSSLGRLGLIVHATAGFVDPGFRGSLTLEITNFNSVPIVLRSGIPIAQLSFLSLDGPAERPYGHPELGSHYLGQLEATESRYEAGPARNEGGTRGSEEAS